MGKLTKETGCPDCGGSWIVRSHRRLFERILLCVPIFLPFRCRYCGCRFYAFQNPFRSFWVKFFTAFLAFGLVAAIGLIWIKSNYLNHLEKSATWFSEQIPLLSLRPDFGLVAARARQEAVAGSEIPKSVLPSDVAQNAVPLPSLERAELVAQESSGIRPRRKVMVLRADAGWVRENSSTNSRPKFLLKKHDRVLILSERYDWYLVRLEEGQVGWAHQSLF